MKSEKLKATTQSVELESNKSVPLKAGYRSFAFCFLRFEFEKGFTLLEFLIYSAIGSMVVVLAVQISLNVFFSAAKAERASEVAYNGSFALEIITHVLRNGQSVTTPIVNRDATTLVVRMQNGALNPTVFTFSGGRMYMREDAGPITPITSSSVVVSNILFQNVQVSGRPSAVRASLTVSAANPSNHPELRYSENFSTTAAVRMRP